MGKNEWRTIPDFPLYEVTAEGDVRNRDTWKLLKEQENLKTGAWSYSLWKDGRNYSRNFWTLVYSAYPELKPKPQFRTIPGYERYTINKEGTVKNEKREVITNRPRGGEDGYWLGPTKANKTWERKDDLVTLVFGGEK